MIAIFGIFSLEFWIGFGCDFYFQTCFLIFSCHVIDFYHVSLCVLNKRLRKLTEKGNKPDRDRERDRFFDRDLDFERDRDRFGGGDLDRLGDLERDRPSSSHSSRITIFNVT